MAYNFKECNRDQIFLLPPNVRKWLPEGDLALFIIDAVGQMDLKAFYQKYRPDGRGQTAYEPSMLLTRFGTVTKTGNSISNSSLAGEIQGVEPIDNIEESNWLGDEGSNLDRQIQNLSSCR